VGNTGYSKIDLSFLKISEIIGGAVAVYGQRGRLWLADGSCIRLRPEHRNHVWSYDFVEDRTHDGRKYRMLNVLDEFTHECLAIRVARKLRAIDVIDVLSTCSSCGAFPLISGPTTDRS
jgi:hypothetical protein